MADTCALILETSTPQASIALAGPDGSLDVRHFTSDRGHNAVMFTPLQELLAGRGGLKITLVLVGSGPGSYSGTRVGIAAAQGIAIAFGCPAVAVPSILAVPAAAHGHTCLAIGDARRGSYWTARVANSRLLSPPTLTTGEGLSEEIEASLMMDSTLFSFEHAVRFPLPTELIARVNLDFPTAPLLWQAWCKADGQTRAQWASEVPQPIYLKPPHITPARVRP